MKDLLEKLDWIFAGHKKGQKDGDQVRGTEKAKKKKRKTPYQEHPFKGRLVGGGGSSAEEMEETVEELAENYRKELAEYGAPGTAISGGDDDSREQIAAMRRDERAQKKEMMGQKAGLVAQINDLRRQITAIKRQPEPIPNPKDPASIMQLSQAKADKRNQVKGLAQQIASLEQQLAQMRE
jgi:polyhydroxyalkanoate synthesis regulator phasin